MTATSRSVGVGVIGARSMVATRAVLPAIDAAAGVHVAAVAALGGPPPSRWAHLAVETYEAVLDHPDVDAVYIPLPNGLHAPWAERAAGAGLDVLCEKPLAPTAGEAAAMVAGCEAHGVLLAEAWMTPFDPRWRHAVDSARRGDVGPVRSIDAAFTFTISPDAAANYRWDPALGGGALLDVGIYCLGPITEFWGTHPDEITVRRRLDDRGVDATTTATLRWDDGRVGTIRCSFVEPERQYLRLTGSEGSLVLDGDAHTGGTAARTIGVESHGAPPAPHDPTASGAAAGAAPGSASVGETTRSADSAPSRRLERTRTIVVDADDPYRLMVERFADAVRGPMPWPRPAARSVDLLALVDRIRAEPSAPDPSPIARPPASGDTTST